MAPSRKSGNIPHLNVLEQKPSTRHFEKPREAKDSVEVEDGIVYRIADNEVVGITVTGFKARALKK